MRRRGALTRLIALCAAAYMPGVHPQARRSSPYRIGVPITLTPPSKQALVEEMRRLGWAYEKDYVFIDSGLPYGPHVDEAARRVVSQRPDIVYVSTTAYAAAVHRLTSEIPIVMYSSGYPVQAGLANSLASPGKNVTGNTTYAGTGIWGKLLQLLGEAKPGVRRIGLLWDYLPPAFPREEIEFGMHDLRKDAQSLGFELHAADVSRPEETESAISLLEAQRVEAVLVTSGPAIFPQRANAIRRLSGLRLPTVTDTRWIGDISPLLAYGPPAAVLRQQAVSYIYRILNGAKAGDLPIQQPSRFELVVNLTTAKRIGLSLPQSLLLRADEVLQ